MVCERKDTIISLLGFVEIPQREGSRWVWIYTSSECSAMYFNGDVEVLNEGIAVS